MIIKLFTKKDCPRCPSAKKVIVDLRSSIDVKVEDFDVETVEGMAEAAYYMVMATPTILVCDDGGNEVAGWRGEAPKLEELKDKLNK